MTTSNTETRSLRIVALGPPLSEDHARLFGKRCRVRGCSRGSQSPIWER